MVGLIGPNGAGKSTLVNIITGFDFPDDGSVELEGRDVTRWRPDRRGRRGLARTFQHSRSFRALSVRENVEVSALGAGLAPRAARRRADRLLEQLQLTTYASAPRGRSRARRRAAARRRPGAGDGAEIRAHGRARSRPARGGGARLRCRNPLRARRARRGRAPDRPQHGARDGRVRPDPGPRSRCDPCGGDAASRSAPTSTSPRHISARARCTRRRRERAHSPGRRNVGRVWREPGRARPLTRASFRRDPRAHRPERRGQVDHPARVDGPRPALGRRGDVRWTIAARTKPGGHRPLGDRARSGRPPPLRRAHRGGEPAARTSGEAEKRRRR